MALVLVMAGQWHLTTSTGGHVLDGIRWQGWKSNKNKTSSTSHQYSICKTTNRSLSVNFKHFYKIRIMPRMSLDARIYIKSVAPSVIHQENKFHYVLLSGILRFLFCKWKSVFLKASIKSHSSVWKTLKGSHYHLSPTLGCNQKLSHCNPNMKEEAARHWGTSTVPAWGKLSKTNSRPAELQLLRFLSQNNKN